MTRSQTNIDVFYIDVWTIEGRSRDQALEWSASEFARTGTQIGATYHCLRYACDFNLARNICLRFRQLFGAAERRNSKQRCRVSSIERGLEGSVVFACTRRHQRKLYSSSISFRQASIRNSEF